MQSACKLRANCTQQNEDDKFNEPRQIKHNWGNYYGFNSVLDSRKPVYCASKGTQGAHIDRNFINNNERNVQGVP